MIEVAGSPAGAYAGRLLAACGAEVLRLEPPEGDPWRRYVEASVRLKWATEDQTRLHEKQAEQELIGHSVKDFTTKFSRASDRWMEEFKKKGKAGEKLDKWLEERGINANTSGMIRWFVSNYHASHEVLQSSPPDLVYRVAVHERRSNCP